MLGRASLLIFVALACLLHPQQARAQYGKLYPVDEASQDPSFFVFRARLLLALQQRDAGFVLSILSPDVLLSFGGHDGVEEFEKRWQPERPDSPLWNELMVVLALGGAFRDGGEGRYFAAPYTYTNFLHDGDGGLEAFEAAVSVEENVSVRREPSANSPLVATLSFDIVKVADWEPSQPMDNQQHWVKVAVAEGVEGFVPEEFLRSPIHYRAVFRKREGRWLLTAFVGGD